MNMIINFILIISIIVLIYIIASLCLDKKKLIKKEVYEVKNTKYIIGITVLIILFVVYGILRNFK